MRSLILCSTIYGHNLEMSRFIKRHLLKHADVSKIDSFDAACLETYDLLIVCPCTYDEGILQPADTRFVTALKQQDLSGAKFLIIGVGDKTFGHSSFANATNIFQHRLKQCGATPLMPALKYDYGDLNVAWGDVTAVFEHNPILRRACNE